MFASLGAVRIDDAQHVTALGQIGDFVAQELAAPFEPPEHGSSFASILSIVGVKPWREQFGWKTLYTARRSTSGRKAASRPMSGRNAHSRYTDSMPIRSASAPSTAAPRPPIPNANSTNRHEIIPTHPGTGY